jgi:hypothetical protein
MSICNVDALCVYLECAVTSVSVLVDEAALCPESGTNGVPDSRQYNVAQIGALTL